MAGIKHGIDTDPYDRETRDAVDEFVKMESDKEWSYQELQLKYKYLKKVTLKNLPDLWPALEFAITVKTILNVSGIDLPFIGIILGPPSSMKSVAVDLFEGYKHTYYTDSFSPRSFVSHLSGKTEKELRKIDLLPRIRNKQFLTPELSPMFSVKEDDLHNVIGMLTRIADGKGFKNDSGAQGNRGYRGKMMFTWTGAAVDIPYKVHKLLSYLGPKLYFFRIPYVEKTEDEYFERRNDDFHVKREGVKSALFEYLFYFEMNPNIVIEEEQDTESLIWNGHEKDNALSNNEDGMLPKVVMHPEGDDSEVHRIIIKVAMLLIHLRASVIVWDSGTQGTDYNYTFAHIEEADRAIEQMRNLARAHALSQGRTSLTMDDVPIVIHTALSTASHERVRLFEVLLDQRGTLSTETVSTLFDISAPTARKTMTELKAIKLVDDITGTPNKAGHFHPEKTIRLKQKFEWFLSDEFKALKDKMCNTSDIATDMLKEKYPPKKGVKIENEGTIKDNIQDTEETKDNTQSDQKEPLLGGKKPFNISTEISYSSSTNEPNGGNWERKGLSNVFHCLDCELLSFQVEMENHICPAWPEKKRLKEEEQEQTELQMHQDQEQDQDKDQNEEDEKSKLGTGEWLLDK